MSTTVYAEIEHDPLEGKWRAGIVCERDGLWACPGLDDWFETRDQAVADALDKMDNYVAECEDQGEDVRRGGILGG